ncbi:molybdopterin converting factor subunit 1 [Chitinimonas koreensis]|uniref:molybdopterin converting factor subunit 1 n=1 Tax=Chitinimonas koreensis TaxID=356302 RepID=UPI0003FD2E09|nr:molybdopterin converting factor subunit 1 [Chitinimonas koreensis]QNM95147.1 molybdopterin converting factor subunit 1 [Chitinimonas koreensis]
MTLQTIRILYFARLREAFDLDGEVLALPPGCADVAGLLALLRARGGAWAAELAEGRVFRVAVEQDMARHDTALAAGAEVAIFPPVTGG